MKKLLNKKGFTLMEMLIVVAIIVILVAISIPTFSGSLDKANIAADEANLRSAKAAVLAYEMDGASADDMYYDIESGTLVENEPTEAAGACSKHDGKHIKIVSGEAVWDGADADYTKKCD